MWKFGWHTTVDFMKQLEKLVKIILADGGATSLHFEFTVMVLQRQGY